MTGEAAATSADTGEAKAAKGDQEAAGGGDQDETEAPGGAEAAGAVCPEGQEEESDPGQQEN